MSSPAPFTLQDTKDTEALALLEDSITADAPNGMKSTLYGYQRRTLWKLLQRELLPQHVLDPDLMECKSPDSGAPYWIQISTGSVFASPFFWEENRGGIICEDMGTGKTCIAIALILQTRHHISIPPVDCVDQKVYADLDPYWLGIMDSRDDNEASVRRAPSLKKLVASHILTHRIPFTHYKDIFPSHLYKLLRKSPSYFFKYANQNNMWAASRGRVAPKEKIYLSSCTLVVVPDTLVDQWQTELIKHVHDLTLEVLILSNTIPVPDALTLLKYDIVLISHPRFGAELDGVTKDGERYRSPLLDIRWLRMIVDEGHVMARKEANQVALAAKLECDRRWVCTGTPMPNILRKNFDAEEQKDLQKLGALLTDFLRVEPFASSRDVFRNMIMKPFLERGFRGYEKLQDLMSRLMVRNKLEDIERDVKLPPLHETIVTLELGYTQRLLHNCIIAFIGANAVLSEREHQDYFFHANNAKPLKDVINNLQLSCFWFADPEFISQLHTALNNVTHALIDDKESPHYSPADLAQLTQIQAVLTTASQSDLLRNIVKVVDVVYEVRRPHAQLGGKTTAWTDVGNAVLKGADLEAFQKRKQKERVTLGIGTGGGEEGGEVLGSASVKLSYLADQIIKHSPTEKIIIYCQFIQEIYYLHEVCRIAKVRCILFHRQMRVSERSHSVTTFNTSPSTPIIIMDLRLAAWGIDLSSASRVYFVSPVWQHDMERQAIKRAHRIGATHPVYVETLVARGTMEEAVLRRRGEILGSGDADEGRRREPRSMLEDGKLRGMLSAAKMVESNSGEDTDMITVTTEEENHFTRFAKPIPLIPAPGLALHADATDYYVDAADERVGDVTDLVVPSTAMGADPGIGMSGEKSRTVDGTTHTGAKREDIYEDRDTDAVIEQPRKRVRFG
ncbi:SNF2 family N-terminal domain-containing protein [Fimicolochytrium jonesii]|uniref:SNF2 family N-terminal domain-containing protein n=1 Tax=Fimicolochytrium jonesii TaxID=1396493 RepID=UPI0022FEFD37|nr:SNF2 family N-terminal domain-containing protein [Fimicolochytrium jonesii]KAI8822029.1 SNF2 family N-terminal domain-containing protein [Fimicolochytrium jonesii]